MQRYWCPSKDQGGNALKRYFFTQPFLVILVLALLALDGYLVWAAFLAPKGTRAPTNAQNLSPAPAQELDPEGGGGEYYVRSYKELSSQESSAGELLPLGKVAVDLAWKLALVIGLVYGVAWAYRRLRLKGGFANGAARSTITILERLPLAASGALYLVEVQGQQLLLGSTEGQLSLLSQLEAGSEAPSPPVDTAAFQEVLEGLKEQTSGPQMQLDVDPRLRSILERIRESTALIKDVGEDFRLERTPAGISTSLGGDIGAGEGRCQP